MKLPCHFNVIDDKFDAKYGYLSTHKYHEIVYNSVYVFDELNKEFKGDNLYIDFLRLILTTFIPKIKVDYSAILDIDMSDSDSNSNSNDKTKTKPINTLNIAPNT